MGSGSKNNFFILLLPFRIRTFMVEYMDSYLVKQTKLISSRVYYALSRRNIFYNTEREMVYEYLALNLYIVNDFPTTYCLLDKKKLK